MIKLTYAGHIWLNIFLQTGFTGYYRVIAATAMTTVYNFPLLLH